MTFAEYLIKVVVRQLMSEAVKSIRTSLTQYKTFSRDSKSTCQLCRCNSHIFYLFIYWYFLRLRTAKMVKNSCRVLYMNYVLTILFRRLYCLDSYRHKKMESASRVQIMADKVCVHLTFNRLGKGITVSSSLRYVV